MAVDKASNKESENGVMDSTMPLAVVDTDMTSNIGKYVDGLHLTGRPSRKIFKVSMRHKAKAKKTATMEHKLRKPARTFDIVPGVVLNLLATTSKF